MQNKKDYVVEYHPGGLLSRGIQTYTWKYTAWEILPKTGVLFYGWESFLTPRLRYPSLLSYTILSHSE
jgi:hypothetical protein